MAPKKKNAVPRSATKQRILDRETRIMAQHIVKAQRLTNLKDAERFCVRWIMSAAQHARNEAYWQNRTKKAEQILKDVDTKISEAVEQISGGNRAR